MGLQVMAFAATPVRSISSSNAKAWSQTPRLAQALTAELYTRVFALRSRSLILPRNCNALCHSPPLSQAAMTPLYVKMSGVLPLCSISDMRSNDIIQTCSCAQALMTALYEMALSFIPSLLIPANSAKAKPHRPSLLQALMAELHDIVSISKLFMNMDFSSWIASYQFPHFWHAAIAEPYAIRSMPTDEPSKNRTNNNACLDFRKCPRPLSNRVTHLLSSIFPRCVFTMSPTWPTDASSGRSRNSRSVACSTPTLTKSIHLLGSMW
mmetsp:Transcript_2338/g.5861  ORF Transcript_2338/g.5861 Transcript_2338/m.5861 type:complete len:266 (+) Transcript_2338:936-1733(+)